MSFAALQESVLDQGLCAVCGVCAAACPADAISFDDLTPTLREDWTVADCGGCNDCLRACPGVDPETPEIETRMFGRPRTPEERWLGIVSEFLVGRALDRSVYERSSSGGCTTALLQAAGSLLAADYMLSMGRSSAEPWKAAPVLADDPAALIETTQSTYQIVPYLQALRPVLAAEECRRVVVVGLPCHAQGIRKLQMLPTDIGERARERIVFVVEIACSSGTPPARTASFITDVARLPLSEVTGFRYRDGDYPGGVSIDTAGGACHRYPFWQIVRYLGQGKTHRCLSCPDWLAGVADVAVSDGDSNVFAASFEGGDQPKRGRVYVRSALGRQVVEYACEAGMLEVQRGEPTGFNLGLERKRHRRARYERGSAPIPADPIPGYREDLELRSDDEILAASERRAE